MDVRVRLVIKTEQLYGIVAVESNYHVAFHP